MIVRFENMRDFFYLNRGYIQLKFSKVLGFTLAEVLVTIGIIGIVGCTYKALTHKGYFMTLPK